jgi:hypothetical protein
MEDLADTMHGDASDFLQRISTSFVWSCWRFFLAIKDGV